MVSICVASFGVNANTPVNNRWAEVVDYADALSAQAQHRCIALGMIDKGVQSLHYAGDCSVDSQFEIGSITKTFTTTLLAMAVARGEVELEDSLAQHVPDIVLKRPITFLQLATHTSGLPRVPSNLNVYDAIDPYRDYGAQQLLDFLAEFDGEPSAQPDYSNLGLGLLGYVLAQKVGLTFEALVRRDILDPLRMRQTAQEHVPELVAGYDDSGKAVPRWRFDALAGAGALVSTLPDMMKYMQAQLTPGDTPLGSAISATHKRRVKWSGVGGIGLGWMRNANWRKGVLGHDGGTGGFRSFAAFDERGHRAVVVLVNEVMPEAELMGQALMGQAVVLPDPVVQEMPQSLDLKQFTGRFKLRRNFMLDITLENGNLFAQATGQPALDIRYVAPDRFRTKLVAAEIEFHRSKNGDIEALTLHQGGQQLKGKRLGPVPVPVTVKVAAATLSRYPGEYELAPGFTLTVTLEGEALFIQATGQARFQVHAENDTTFFYTVVDAKVEFDVKDGVVQGLTLHQGGANYARRLPAN